MQRKATAQSRGANAAEKKFHAWVKVQRCGFCQSMIGSNVDHCKGSSYKHHGLLIGHLFVNPKCSVCDFIVTNGVRKELFNLYGMTDSDVTLQQLKQYEIETGTVFDDELLNAISDVYTVHDDTTDIWMTVLK